MLKLGAAKKDALRSVPHTEQELAAHGLTYRLRRKMRQVTLQHDQ